MSETVQYIKKVGGSLMVRIPKDIVSHEHLKEGQKVKIKISSLKESGFGVFPDLEPWHKDKDRMSSPYD